MKKRVNNFTLFSFFMLSRANIFNKKTLTLI